jgi:hypothetical protein
MEYILLLIFILILLYTFFLFFQKNEYFQNIHHSFLPNIYDTNILLSPNIPTDKRYKFKIGGKHCKEYNFKIVPENGKYIFPKQELLYDGIYKSKRKFYNNKDNDIELQKWNIINKYYPINDKYATNNFFHIPKKGMGPDKYLRDTNIYFPDWLHLKIKDRNQSYLDICNKNKHPKHINGIRYLESGI